MSRFIILLSAIFVALALLTQQANATSASSAKSIVKTTNKLRARHHSPPVKWDTTLANYAQKWSNRCEFTHSRGSYGENLALGYPNWTSVINGWYSEVKDYHYDQPGFTGKTGHFTALVWKSTTKIGCGVKTCNNLGKGIKLYTCSFSSPGNMVSADNVYFVQNIIKP